MESPYIAPVEYTSIPCAAEYPGLSAPEPSPLFLSPASPALRPLRSYRPPSAIDASTSLRDDLDAQADIESDGDATDDEYVPSSSANPAKRRRSTRTAPASRTPDKGTARSTPRPSKRPRSSPPSRNVQAISGTVSTSQRNNPWACPHCKWVQRNHRTPDLKRHIRTHTRFERPSQWVCCGVSLKDAGGHDLPEDATPYSWNGKMMIGGCGKEFSRRDALKRHLDNEHMTCIGDMNAFATSYED